MLLRLVLSGTQSLAVALCFVFALTSPGTAQPVENTAPGQSVELTVPQALGLAQQELTTNPRVSENIAQILLANLPGHYDALMVLAAARLVLGNYPAAAQAAKLAFANAPHRQGRHNAARLASSAHFRAGQFSRSEWWLRRAFNNTASDAERQVLAGEFNTVRRANPFTAQLSFSLAPNSNINNGSSSETVLLFGAFLANLSVDARPLAGFEASVSADLKYRLSESQTHRTEAGLTLYSRTFELSASAKSDLAKEAAAAGNPVTVKGSDFAFSVAEVSLKHTQIFENFPGPSSFAVNLGANWYGGEPLSSYSRMTFTQDFGLSDRTNLQLSLTGSHQVPDTDPRLYSDVFSLGGTITHLLGSGDTVGISVNLQETQSPDLTLESAGVSAQLNYRFAQPIWGMALSGNISSGRTDYSVSNFSVDGRHDITIGLGLTAVFVNLAYFGFSPSMSLEASQTNSSIDFFDRESLGLRFGIQSTF